MCQLRVQRPSNKTLSKPMPVIFIFFLLESKFDLTCNMNVGKAQGCRGLTCQCGYCYVGGSGARQVRSARPSATLHPRPTPVQPYSQCRLPRQNDTMGANGFEVEQTVLKFIASVLLYGANELRAEVPSAMDRTDSIVGWW